MSVKTTHYIPRDLAILILLSKVHKSSDEELCEMLESCEESIYRNYTMDEKASEILPSIKTASQFFNDF